jgi:chemotaxis regulatin CheY-phosphate phosphatase CheZ
MTSRLTEPGDGAGIAGLQNTETLAGRSVVPVGEGQSVVDGPTSDLVVSGHCLIFEAIGQLAAVVELTEIAANQIIDACDALTALGGAISAAAEEQIKRAVTTILEACGFQDLTGQRIGKAVKSLRLIDSSLGDPTRASLGELAAALSANAGSQGLQKPHRRAVAIDQSVADRLFAQSS